MSDDKILALQQENKMLKDYIIRLRRHIQNNIEYSQKLLDYCDRLRDDNNV